MTTLHHISPDDRLRVFLEVVGQEGLASAASGFSGMIGEALAFSAPQVRRVPLADIPALLGGPEAATVGIYLQAHGDMAGQILLVMAYGKALELADLILSEPPGTTKELGPLERSALAELGNLTGSFFLNAVARTTGLSARPGPPAVMVDMLGAILDVVVSTYNGEERDDMLILHAAFLRGGQEVEADFWVIPDPAALERFEKTFAEFR